MNEMVLVLWIFVPATQEETYNRSFEGNTETHLISENMIFEASEKNWFWYEEILDK